MESFYGGRQGASFVIKHRFAYLDTEDPSYLADGGSESIDPNEVMSEYVLNQENKDFWYGEYCIIDTTNKNNPNNGKIYRRTIVNEGVKKPHYPYAEYIGQIVGPCSGAPLLEINDFGLEANNARLKNESADWNVLGFKDSNGNLVCGKGINGQAYELYTHNISIDNNSLVPGYFKDENGADAWVDEIKYNWYNVQENTKENDGIAESWCRIGFQIPYTVFTTSAQSIAPGEEPTVVNNSTHPFHCDLSFEIPGGLRGLSIERIFTNKNSNGEIEKISAYAFDDLSYENDIYTLSETLNDYETYGWFCEARIVNRGEEEKVATFYLGEINELKDVKLENGALTFSYYNKEDDVYSLEYPVSIAFNPDNGEMTVTKSTGDSSSLGALNFIKEVKIDEGHRLLVKYANNESMGEDPDGDGFINYGSLLSTPMIKNGDEYLPHGESNSSLKTVDEILKYCNENWQADLADGSIYIVTPEDTLEENLSHFIRWNTESSEWEDAGQIGAQVEVNIISKSNIEMVEPEFPEESFAPAYPWS